MKRKTLIVVILAVLSIPANISYAVENEVLFEDTIDSEVLDEIQDDQLEDIESSVEIGTESGLEEALEEVKESDEPTVSESVDQEEVKESSIEVTKTQNKEAEVIASGQNGTGFTWTLYEDGVLVCGGGTWSGSFSAWYSWRSQITKVIITDEIDPPNNSDGFSTMFYNCSNLIAVEGLEKLKTGNAKSFALMFYNCERLETIDLSSFDTSSSTSFASMFENCVKLEKIDCSKFKTTNSINFSKMFAFCRNVKELDVANFDVSKAINLSGMFQGCNSISSIDVSKFNTENTTNFSSMFIGYKGTQLDVSNFNTEKATDMSFMFQNVSNIAELDVSNFQMKNVKNMEYMFSAMTSLTNLNLQGFDVSNVEKISACFSGLASIERLDLSHFVTNNLREAEYVFRNMTNLKELNIDNWIIPSNVSVYKFFEGTLSTKITIGSRVTLNTLMYMPDLSRGYVWADTNDEIIDSDQLVAFHNKNGVSNTYRIEELHTLTFDTIGGSEVDSQRSIIGKNWIVPDIPEKKGYIFDYWSTDKDGENPYDFKTPISSSLILYAQYTPAYTVSIPATINLNETNQLKVVAENYVEAKTLIISTDEKVSLRNIHDSTRILEKEITKEKEYPESTNVLEVAGIKKEENTLYIQQAEEKELAGTYEGILNFTIDFY
ncbi:BspA family leucine-rich repeat surface protein [Enterococcus mundtii]|uniref:BspA family leucine-rich repeat surface protein n=1 Tax=Enterococcus mundtii TaxID=53346 RepID=UPI0013780E87|nr:BspA family leucine-rich repeat surface protein [Enterococcus mundtii]NBA60750.1 BspA family leucine-rich repeat surface protein [Enterococcus mundtii]